MVYSLSGKVFSANDTSFLRSARKQPCNLRFADSVFYDLQLFPEILGVSLSAFLVIHYYI